jgi:hypothetical protein
MRLGGLGYFEIESATRLFFFSHTRVNFSETLELGPA